ncbi:MAG TPA: sensor histidine kinase [Candidatus Paenibacillus intestinavium]|nr:sensor histidine kinase [Candidatus Paenibacillus intestinavium]
MKRIFQKLGLEYTQGQIFIGFIITMAILLATTVSLIYIVISKEQKESTMLYIEEIAQQASGRIESLLNEVNVLTLQLAVDDRTQDILAAEVEGHDTTYEDRMLLRKMLIDKTAYSDTIHEIEIYSRSKSIYPIVNTTIEERISEYYIDQANVTENAGAMIWIGIDQWDSQYLLAIRHVKLEKQGYSNGGYLVVRLKPSLINLAMTERAQEQGAIMRLIETNDSPNKQTLESQVLLSIGQLEGALDQYLVFERNIKGTSWALQMMVPRATVYSDLYFLRDILIVLGVVSVIIFAIISYFLANLISAPIKGLTRIIQGSKHGAPRENPAQYFNKEVNQLNFTYNQMVRQIDYLITSVYEKELVKSQSELKALHSQLNPHFLFNTLDSIYWDHIRKGEKELAQSIIQLADMFRYSIHSKRDDGLVTIKEELDQVKRYADLMRMRWQDRLELSIVCEDELYSCILPKLVIQPLVENAIVHGIEPLADGGKVTIAVERKLDSIEVVVSDNGIGISSEDLIHIQKQLIIERNFVTENQGIGLFNINRVIKLHYGDEYGLTLQSEHNQGTTVKLTIPLLTAFER